MTPPRLPRQASAPEGGGTPPTPAEDRGRVVRRRWITAIIILLLVGVPAGYLLVSAQQSRESGRDKAAKIGAVHVRPAWPSAVQRSIYEVPIPDEAWRVGYLETNNWHTSRLFTEFTVTARDLDAFLADVGTSRAELTPGAPGDTISAHDARVAGWTWPPGTTVSAVTLEQPDPRPTRDIVVDFSGPNPRVYVVSTATP
ncbi:hypothetical protein MTF65_28935 [Streptomyces sp. APSN-46.1]|uniref:hypothetical protein n=1 Tax=Streptomyces sp. APSN-46.1 TaxID=2929049 RepID=UPI001FB22BB3|nr:hypothetical protein [Streptomyces sp. APSN-46.1]MCJ1681310.1 hypothetical protein [Streptomyces sp. APSN-46.1]